MTEQQYADALAGFEDVFAEDAVPLWGGTVDDGKFVAVVCPEEGMNARFIVKHVESDETLHDEPIELEDLEDVDASMRQIQGWMTQTIEVVDKWYTDRGETPPQD